jgi:hypothetical protein
VGYGYSLFLPHNYLFCPKDRVAFFDRKTKYPHFWVLMVVRCGVGGCLGAKK